MIKLILGFVLKEPFPEYSILANYQRRLRIFWPLYESKNISAVLNSIRQIYPLRTCKYLLSEQNIQEGKFKECLSSILEIA